MLHGTQLILSLSGYAWPPRVGRQSGESRLRKLDSKIQPLVDDGVRFGRYTLRYWCSSGAGDGRAIGRRGPSPPAASIPPLTQISALKGITKTECMSCHATTRKDFLAHVVDLIYPRPVSRVLPHCLRFLIFYEANHTAKSAEQARHLL
jgi:hypothetical protein